MKEKPCSKQTDCRRNECCESRQQFRGKRDLTSLSPGICKRRPRVGQSCIAEFLVPLPTDGTFRRCPCAGKLQCEENGLTDIPTGKMGTCVRKITPQPCNTASDCKRNECCVSKTRPIGKRDTSQSFVECLTRNNEPSQEVRFVSCQCGRGLTCVPDGGNDIPLGPTGKYRLQCSSLGHKHNINIAQLLVMANEHVRGKIYREKN
ncbi:hypothetical protein KUTeg_010446 [Tegillarca granosa]|uniref:Uncharacterized protein n=1 Tax=Tegillarca granosa TaxID=220873 RepID=A0ABQ9F6R2_TEGGR|nr:hypothetical protein KUTeg_010446 [Tegillarca granosa]